ncbi:hypothetical protein [Thalassospira lucentensis]|uniref:hypothetical protein n=1 Tax=Thalassospira lucentensis TaxID=168935 RepID=UPI00399D71B2
MATIVRDTDDTEYAYGPSCIFKVLDEARGHQIKDIPDFTKGLKPEVGASVRGNSVVRTVNSHVEGIKRSLKKKALTYLMLRQEKVPGVSYDVLSNYLEKYKSDGDLSEGEIRHILNIEKKMYGTKLGEKNLMTVYAYLTCVNQAMPYVQEERRGFLRSIKQQLTTKYYLTVAQIEKTGEWVSRVPGEISLSETGFFRK